MSVVLTEGFRKCGTQIIQNESMTILKPMVTW